MASSQRWWKTLTHGRNWIYLLPALIFFVGYQVYPILRVFWISFTDYHYLRQQPAQFIGFQNYVNAFGDQIMYQGLLRAATFTAIFLPGTIFVPLFVAILVDRVKTRRIATMYRLILLIPAVIPGPMIFILWTWLYNFEIGPINHVLVDVLHLLPFEMRLSG
jgi:multiple sugar transport system permease protein